MRHLIKDKQRAVWDKTVVDYSTEAMKQSSVLSKWQPSHPRKTGNTCWEVHPKTKETNIRPVTSVETTEVLHWFSSKSKQKFVENKLNQYTNDKTTIRFLRNTS